MSKMRLFRGERWPSNSPGRWLRCPYLAALLAVLLCGLMLSACGWQLRGSSAGLSLEGQGIYVVDSIGNSGLRRAMRQGIQGADGRQVESRERADLILTLHSSRSEREIGSVDMGGEIQDYRLTYSVKYSVEDDAGNLLVESQSANARRTFAEMGGGADQRQTREDDVEQELMGDVARMILLRLQSL